MTDALRKSIRKLETRARELEPGGEERRRLFAEVGAYAEDFLSRLPDLPAFVETEDRGSGSSRLPSARSRGRSRIF